MKFIFVILAMASLIGPLAYAFHMSTTSYTKTFWEFYPLLVSGALLSLVFFFAAGRNNTN